MSDIKVLIEIPENTHVKYEYDEETGMMMLDRIVPTATRYPINYGSIPGTLGKDGDPLDALVLMSATPIPGCVVKCKVIGLLEMEDEEGIDTKIVCVPVPKVDFLYGKLESIDDIPEYKKDQIKHFFEHYKDLEPSKWVKLKGWGSAAEAVKLVDSSKK